MPLIVNATIVCDDIRIEDNGKIVLIGVYTPHIVLDGLPAFLPALCLFQVLESDEPLARNMRVRLERGDTPIAEGVLEVRFEAARLGYTLIRFVGVPITDAGTYRVVTLVGDSIVPKPHTFMITTKPR